MERGNFRQKKSYVSPDWDEPWRGDKGVDLFCRRRQSFPSGSVVKNLPAMKEPWVRQIPWRRAWQSTPVFLHGESHGWRSLVGYSLWSHTELAMTEAT